MCNNILADPFPVVVNGRSLGCRADEDTALRRGRYTYVVAREGQRAAVRRAQRRHPGLTFLPFSRSRPTVEHILLLRNMLPADGFAEATSRVPQPGTPAQTEAVMGDYYPRGKICGLRKLTRRGPTACLR
jgi:hypothetical protein